MTCCSALFHLLYVISTDLVNAVKSSGPFTRKARERLMRIIRRHAILPPAYRTRSLLLPRSHRARHCPSHRSSPAQTRECAAQTFFVECIRPSCAFVHQAFRPPPIVVFFRAFDVPVRPPFRTWQGTNWSHVERCQSRYRNFSFGLRFNGSSGKNIPIKIIKRRGTIMRYQLLSPLPWISEPRFFLFVQCLYSPQLIVVSPGDPCERA